MDPEKELAEAKRLEDSGEIDDAIGAYHSLIEQCRINCHWKVLADALHCLGRALDLHKSQYEESLEAYRWEVQARRSHSLPGLGAAYLGVAVICHFLEDDEAAIENARAAISRSEDVIGKGIAHNLIGDILMRSHSQSVV